MEIAKDIEIFTKEITWRNNAVIPLGAEDILYLTEKGRAGVLKKASMRDWQWLIEKYHIKYWAYLKELSEAMEEISQMSDAECTKYMDEN